MKEGLVFNDYDKITDTVMWIGPRVNLKFNVSLKYKSASGEYRPFHSEFKSYIKATDREFLSISLYQNSYFSINSIKGSFEDNVILRVNDLVVLKMLYENTILPWFIGKKRVFSYNKDNKLIISGKFQNDVQLPTSDNKYLGFLPIINTYENGDQKEGLRIIINRQDNFVDVSIDKMFELFYYLCNTDILNAAIGLLNYVKTQPYGENLKEVNKKPSEKTHNSYFDKL